jgi:3-hydroxybutyryl-CoA dehydrogenase
MEKIKVGVVGAGAMGSGIAQVAAMAGHQTVLFDAYPSAVAKAQTNLVNTLEKLAAKGKINNAEEILNRITFAEKTQQLADCQFIIEAIIEDVEIKKSTFRSIEQIVSEDCILATNTSSLSITSIAAACQKPNRVLGVHFFNPAPIMELVEIIPAVQSDNDIVLKIKQLVDAWGKKTVLCKDTPGFIVNRIARPFYGEALRIYDEGIADFATIDEAMRTIGGFRMGPFELMDFIGHDVNFRVTESVFQAFYYDPRYKPSFTQKRLFEAGWYGRKSGRGYYDYSETAIKPTPNKDENLQQSIFLRIISMLINEAADVLLFGVGSREDIETAMTKGVNYPKGLMAWAEEIGVENVVNQLDMLYKKYGEDRYRCSPYLRNVV